MPGLPDLVQVLSQLLRSPVGQAGLSYFGGQEQERARNEFNAANQARLEQLVGSGTGTGEIGQLQRALTTEVGIAGQNQYNWLRELGDQMRRSTSQLGNQRLGEFDALTGRLSQRSESNLSNLLGGFDQFRGDIASQLANRTQQGLGYLEGASQQARADINDRFGQQLASDRQNLVSRGLGGTVASAVGLQNQRERGAELRRFDEGVRREYLDTFSRLSGDEAAAAQELGLARSLFQERGQQSALDLAERLGGQRVGMGQELDRSILDTMRSFGLAGITSRAQTSAEQNRIRERLGMERINTIRNVTDIPPGSNWLQQLAMQFGQNAAGTPSQGSSSDAWLPAAIGAGGAVAGGALASAGGASSMLWPLIFMSDRNSKHVIRENVDYEAVLAGVENLDIPQWYYKDDAKAADHIGPMAQDFRTIFGLGDSERTISVVDALGVALAAIKGLSSRVRQLEAERGNQLYT